VPKAHLSLAKERLAAYRRDPTRSRSAHEVIRDLSKPDRWPRIGWLPSRELTSTLRPHTNGTRAKEPASACSSSIS